MDCELTIKIHNNGKITFDYNRLLITITDDSHEKYIITCAQGELLRLYSVGTNADGETTHHFISCIQGVDNVWELINEVANRVKQKNINNDVKDIFTGV